MVYKRTWTDSLLTGVFLTVLLSTVFYACQDENPPQSEATPSLVDTLGSPNDRSELAILMRNLYDDLKAHQSELAQGEVPDVEWVLKYKHMPSATPTDPSHANPTFQAFAQQYLENLKNFEEANDSSRITLYNRMIDNCLVCHQQYCHGPMEAIGKLKINP